MTNKKFLTHQQREEMRKKIELEWDQTMDIKEYFDKLYREAVKLDCWEIEAQPSELAVAGVDQMQDSGIFDHKFLRAWEIKPEKEKSWQGMKDYVIPEYRSIKTYEGSNRDVLEKVQNVQEGGKDDKVEVLSRCNGREGADPAGLNRCSGCS